MPASWADRVIAKERRVNSRPWHEQTSDQGPPRSRFSIAGLNDDPTDWKLAATEAAINIEHAARRTGLHAADLLFDEAHRTASFARADRADLRHDTRAFETARNEDRKRLARDTGLDVLHRQRILELLQEERQKTEVWYAPIDFGRGIVAGGDWSTETGTGRWDYLNGPLVAPYVRGKRVLELGTNNGVGGLMMLKAGASHVSAIEYEVWFADTARLAQRIFSWADLHNYQLDVKQGDMRAILPAELPEFDVVSAYCSLYYLSEDEMAQIVQKAASLAGTLILQSNDFKHNGRDTLRRKQASTEYTRALALNNGFRTVDVHQPQGYPRALLIAKR